MNQEPRKRVFQITGMTCGHCKSAVESAIRATDGVTAAQVDLKAGKHRRGAIRRQINRGLGRRSWL